MADTPQSKGGRARAQSMSKFDLSHQAREAARARWTNAKGRTIHEAIDEGTLEFGDLRFRCAVLDDESRVISGTEFMKGMGIYRSGGLSTRRQSDDDGFYVPLYLAQKNLQPHILEDPELVAALAVPLLYRGKRSRSLAEGIPGQVLRRICQVWVRAQRAGVLGPTQERVAEKAEKLVSILADIGIIGLIDEATGYQKRRARDDLQKILRAYIAEELLPWQKRFPDSFYENLYRVRGWEYKPQSNLRTSYIGKLTNLLIYAKLPPGVLDDLRQRNPVDPATKRRKRTHHEHLTEDVGHPHLHSQINAVTTLLRATPDGKWDMFARLFQRAFPPPQRDLFDDLELEEDNAH